MTSRILVEARIRDCFFIGASFLLVTLREITNKQSRILAFTNINVSSELHTHSSRCKHVKINALARLCSDGLIQIPILLSWKRQRAPMFEARRRRDEFGCEPAFKESKIVGFEYSLDFLVLFHQAHVSRKSYGVRKSTFLES